MARDRFKGSAESTIGSEIVRWQEKGVYFFNIELFKTLPCLLLEEVTTLNYHFLICICSYNQLIQDFKFLVGDVST